MKKTLLLFVAIIAASLCAKAQINLHGFYDFGKDRKFVTTTFELFHPDDWGDTYMFVDYNYNFKDINGKNIAPGGTYMEIERCLNFWKNTKMSGLNIHLEYDGGFGATLGGGYPINHAFLGGADYTFYWKHSQGFTSWRLKVLYKKYIGVDQKVPLQLSTVWKFADFFGLVKGLTFNGFADFWWQTTDWAKVDEYNVTTYNTTTCAFLAEPQLWYCVGQWFKCPNLHIGGEVEIACNFTGNATKGWHVNPCLGLKWVFNPSK